MLAAAQESANPNRKPNATATRANGDARFRWLRESPAMPRPEDRWNHNIHYHRVILDAIPSGCRRALDVGCGEGTLTRQLRALIPDVVGIDEDLASIAAARAHPDGSEIQYIEADALAHEFEPASCDLITAVASLHHMPAEGALIRFSGLLRPAGVLAAIGLARSSPIDWLLDLARSSRTACAGCAPGTGSTHRRWSGLRRRAMHRCGGSRHGFSPALASNGGSTGATRSCGSSPEPLGVPDNAIAHPRRSRVRAASAAWGGAAEGFASPFSRSHRQASRGSSR
jgi:SAM-dependent methyltransferase